MKGGWIVYPNVATVTNQSNKKMPCASMVIGGVTIALTECVNQLIERYEKMYGDLRKAVREVFGTKSKRHKKQKRKGWW